MTQSMQLHLDPSNPFPLHEEGGFSYGEEQIYAEQVDAWLGLQTGIIENELSQTGITQSSSQELWIGLPVKSLLTPYTELRKVCEGKRCLSLHHCHQAQLIEQDLEAEDFSPQAAPFYFIYDYGSRHAIEKTLNDLRIIAQTASITVVGRGRSSRDAIERNHPWLSQVEKPQHFKNYSIYRSSSLSL